MEIKVGDVLQFSSGVQVYVKSNNVENAYGVFCNVSCFHKNEFTDMIMLKKALEEGIAFGSCKVIARVKSLKFENSMYSPSNISISNIRDYYKVESNKSVLYVYTKFHFNGGIIHVDNTQKNRNIIKYFVPKRQ